MGEEVKKPMNDAAATPKKKVYSGKTSNNHYVDDWEKRGNGPSAITQRTVIEAQWSDMPVEVYEDVRTLWKWLEYGNDHYYADLCIQDIEEIIVWGCEESGNDLGYLMQWLKEKGFKEDDENDRFLLRYWW